MSAAGKGYEMVGARAEAVTRLGQMSVIARLSTLYVGFGMTMSVIQGGLPAVMRAQGASLGSAGWLFALYLPFGLAFLWAPIVDRWRPPVLTRRVGWLVPMQIVAALAVGVAACLEGAPIALLFILGLFVACAMATMDIALDALVVDLVQPGWRPNAAAAKLAALSIGAIIGGGVFVSLFPTLGWRTTFLLCGAVLLAMLLPVLPLRHDEQAVTGATVEADEPHQASLVAIWRCPVQRKRLLVLTFACCVLFPLLGLNRLMLIDLGIPLATIGWVVGTLSPLCMLLTSLVAAPLMRTIRLTGATIAFAGLGLIALGAMAAGFAASLPSLAIGGAVLITAGVSGIYVASTAGILRWAFGRQAATDYSVFYGVGRFASTLIVVAAAQVVGRVGWLTFYGLGAVALLAAVILLLAPLSEKA